MKKKIDFRLPITYTNSAFSALLQQINEHSKLLAQIQAVLPPHLSVHVVYASVIDQRLLVYTESAVWASQLRFYNEVFRVAASNYCGKPVETIKIKILEPEAARTSAKVKIPSLSAIASIEKDAYSIYDKKLQDAMQRLCSSLKRMSENQRKEGR